MHKLDTPAIREALAERFQESFALEDARSYIEEGFTEDDTQPWRGALQEKLDE